VIEAASIAPTGMAALNRVRAYLVLFGCALVGAIVLYYPTRRYGFIYDDYHWVRPYSFREVLSSFWGTWDATHLEVAFYRPLTVTFYAVRFLLFGFSASAYHWASIVLFALAAALFGAFLLRLFGSFALALAGTGLLLLHPAATDTLAAWTINQYQLAEIIIFLCALHWWLTCNGKSTRWWLPLVLFATLCVLCKEDGIMALPAILIIGLIGARLLNRPLAPPPMMYAVACATIGALVLLHYAALRGTVGGYGTPSFGTVLHNLILGPRRILLGRYGPDWSKGCNICLTTAITLLGIVTALVRKDRRAMFLIFSGMTILLTFDLPLALVGRTDQHFLPVHFLAVGHAFILLGAVDALAQAAVAMRTRRVVMPAALALTGAVVFVGLLFIPPHLTTAYTPAQLNVKDDGTFFLTETDPTGNQFAWTKGRSSFMLDFLPRKPIRLIAEMRSAAVAGGPDQPVRLMVNGQEVGQLHPNPRDPSFQSLAVSFTPPLSSLQRLKMEFVTTTFRAPDGRDLGTMVRSVSIDKREAWSGIERRRWLFWALPFLALIARMPLRGAALPSRPIRRWCGRRGDRRMPLHGDLAAALRAHRHAGQEPLLGMDIRLYVSRSALRHHDGRPPLGTWQRADTSTHGTTFLHHPRIVRHGECPRRPVSSGDAPRYRRYGHVPQHGVHHPPKRAGLAPIQRIHPAVRQTRRRLGQQGARRTAADARPQIAR